MNFKEILLVSDFDYTLTNTNHVIPETNIVAIERFMRLGGAFTVGTGRAKASFAPLAGQIPKNAPCIVANGAMLYDFDLDKPLHITPLDDREREVIRELARRFCYSTTLLVESGLEVYLPDDVYEVAENEYTRRHIEVTGMYGQTAPIEEIPLPWLKAVFTGSDETLRSLEVAADSLGVEGVRSLPFMFEIQSRNAGKGAAARWLANSLGRSMLVCVGDAPNDLSMLNAADLAFVPESAAEEMRLDGFRVSAHIDLGTIADVIDTLEKM